MKKQFWMALALVMTLVLACAAVAAETGDAGVPNPVTEYASLEEINALTGGNLVRPSVMGVTGEHFAIISTGDVFDIAEYTFQVNGISYCLRFSADYENEITGVWTDGGTAFEGQPGELEYAEAEDMKLARWANTDGQYTLCIADQGQLEQEQFEGIAAEIMESTLRMYDEAVSAYYASLEGEYLDAISQRAMAEVTANGSEGVTITVRWADSAFAANIWVMNASVGEDGLLYYTDCVSSVVSYDENKNEVTTVNYENGEGYWSESEGKLYWNGAADETCRECVFEQTAA